MVKDASRVHGWFVLPNDQNIKQPTAPANQPSRQCQALAVGRLVVGRLVAWSVGYGWLGLFVGCVLAGLELPKLRSQMWLDNEVINGKRCKQSSRLVCSTKRPNNQATDRPSQPTKQTMSSVGGWSVGRWLLSCLVGWLWLA